MRACAEYQYFRRSAALRDRILGAIEAAWCHRECPRRSTKNAAFCLARRWNRSKLPLPRKGLPEIRRKEKEDSSLRYAPFGTTYYFIVLAVRELLFRSAPSLAISCHRGFFGCRHRNSLCASAPRLFSEACWHLPSPPACWRRQNPNRALRDPLPPASLHDRCGQ